MSKRTETFQSIDPSQLAQVGGGASRVTTRSSSGSNDQLTAMLTQITDSIKALSSSNSSGSDPMQMMMMMMMMGGMGGGGGGGAPAPMAAPEPAPAPVINISTTVKRHGW
jgi:hypothetical protein